MEIYSPAVSSAAAEYISTLNSKVTGGDGPYGRGSRQRLMNLDVPEAAIAAMEKGRNVPIGIEWTSPRDGIVLERNAIEGMRAQPGDVCSGSPITRWCGRWSMSPSAIWAAIAVGPARDRARAQFSRAGVLGKDRRDLSADQPRRRERRACASNCPIRTCC